MQHLPYNDTEILANKIKFSKTLELAFLFFDLAHSFTFPQGICEQKFLDFFRKIFEQKLRGTGESHHSFC